MRASEIACEISFEPALQPAAVFARVARIALFVLSE
jgi:hypothetical protein